MMIYIRCITLGILFLVDTMLIAQERWAWVYTKEFSPAEQDDSSVKDEIILTKNIVPLFTQLIFSWNAYRPVRGHYTFWIQGKDAHTGVWGGWHKMMMWGASSQCSYLSNADTVARHYHVRFEACPGKKMNGFRIKVIAHNGANLRTIHALTAAYTDLSRFKSEDSSYYKDYASTRIKKVPCKSQFVLKHPEKHRLCSPTSCAMLIEYFSREKCNIHTVAHNMFDQGLNSYGSWPFNMAHAFELCQGAYWWRVVRMDSFKQLYTMLYHNYPVAVSVRGNIPGAPKMYNDGHLIVVIGYDADTQSIICHDPACAYDRTSVCKYLLSDFLRAWEKSHRLAYCAFERS